MDCDDGTLHVIEAMRGRLEMMITNSNFTTAFSVSYCTVWQRRLMACKPFGARELALLCLILPLCVLPCPALPCPERCGAP